MTPTRHPSNNAVLGAPEGWDQSQLSCVALPITRTEWNGQPAVVSYWKPTPEELAELADGAWVALWVVGNTHPPLAIDVAP